MSVFVSEVDEEERNEAHFERRHVTIKKGEDLKALYKLNEELGRGKFGVVHLCVEKTTGKNLAAKFIKTQRKEDRVDVQREVEIMQKLQHPRLLQLYDAFDDGLKEFVLILELIRGGELFERVIDDDFVLTEKACTVFLRQICEGLSYMHYEAQVLHLDMKPENILCLTKTGNRIKIIDFGLARYYDPKKKLQVLFGTPEFVAPEVVNFDMVDPRTDMWLSGLSPFMGDNDGETMANVTKAKWDFEDESFNNVSSEAKDFITQCLVKDRNNRLDSRNALNHPWLEVKRTDIKVESALDKKKLKRFVIKRRWQKLFNTYLALKRMGATMTFG
ncbi:myosin light chain kinase family member 4-like isoform X2 [Varroa jacobsoni]|uniref:Protein kinase domain-containing protein n=1 Tax=Varroa destructor TaxID=109461 RepID=A0A7M7K7V0_VARDE|nr:myosin light chain kinase family member 4-like isoform X2 [Varroa destructor]XP_022690306.1 myosin light chain kinase family member 4-like isoform X2 [Varroa jacobsoni]